MPLQATSGAASYDAFGGGVAAVPNYIEDVFSTWLYTGNGSTQTINNGIDLAGKGGLVWNKIRNLVDDHALFDTARGVTQVLASNSTAAQGTQTSFVTAFNSNGFTAGNYADGFNVATWTFRKQPKFFDVVTYTGNGANRNVSHSLGSAPGCIIIKCTSTARQWTIWHRSGTQLNNFAAYFTTGGYIDQGTSTWGTNGGVPSMTSTTFSLGTDSEVNANGSTYVAYLFAHNAGGFGLSGNENVISCGSYVGTGGGTPPQINLGYEPQWILLKNTVTGPWELFDTMRGISLENNNPVLLANTSGAEITNERRIFVNSTGFFPNNTGSAFENENGSTYIYIAIRRGPMAVPTTGTSVFAATATTASVNTQITTGFPVDTNIVRDRTVSSGFQSGFAWVDRLRRMSSDAVNSTLSLQSTNTNAEDTVYGMLSNANNTGFAVSGDYGGTSQIYYSLRRAPGFMDVCCYTGTGVARTVAHNLGVAPELMIVKNRAIADQWYVYSASLTLTEFLLLNTSDAKSSGSLWNTAPTASVFGLGSAANVNSAGGGGRPYVAYLFASAPGVSKVGSYTGTGTTQTINCGFTAGSRFVLIKRTDDVGDWYVWDTARGIVAGNDPYLLLNSTAAEVTSTDYIDTASTGFEISSTAPAAINASGGTYIFLAIA